jgi:hypothetical protein
MPTPDLYISEFLSGLYTQRSPLVTPTTSQGLSTVVRTDSLIDGLNIELSNEGTLVRSAGYSRYCAVAFAAGEWPLAFSGFRNLTGVIRTLVDTQNAVYQFTTNTLTSIFAKSTTKQTSFQPVGNTLYFCDGTSTKKWDGTTVTNMGIATPVSAPTLSFAGGPLTFKTGRQYVYAYRTATHLSTASPVSASTGARTGTQVTLSGPTSPSADALLVEIYATLDGGSNYYFLASIPNTGPSWTYVDTSADANLNNEILAPLNHENDPPPAGASNFCYWRGRMWAAVGNKVYFAGGPDITNGSPEEGWPPANVFVFPDEVTGFAPNNSGLLLFTDSDSYVILGTDSSSFYSQPWQSNFGVANQNCIAQDGDLIFVYTTRRQLFSISDNLEEIGFAIGDKLAAGFTPESTYLALHRNGTDSGLWISDGSANTYRYLITKDSWSTVRPVVGGIGVLATVQTSAGNYQLLAGRATGSGYILNRDLTNFQDDGTNYACYADVGQLVLAPLGGTVVLDSVSVERMPVGSPAVVSVMMQEINGTFVEIPNPVSDPPLLRPSTTIISQRHYLKSAQTPVPQQVRHLRVRVAFPAENAKNELLGLALLK